MAEPGGVAADQLRSFVERIERLEEEKQSIADDIKDVYGEAKGTGFDVARQYDHTNSAPFQQNTVIVN